MNKLQQKVLQDGQVKDHDVLKVDSFLNHQLDVDVLDDIGQQFYDCFKHHGVTKVLTIEASGIAIGLVCAQKFHVPCVFAKKSPSTNLSQDLFTSKVYSYTKQKEYSIMVSKQYITANDRILLVDDFLANGQAMQGLLALVEQAGALVVGIGVCIEKTYQAGGKQLRKKGYPLVSLVKVASLKDGQMILE